jgi:hypothetical protein
MASEEPVSETETPGPEISAPPAPPVESSSSVIGSLDSVPSVEEPVDTNASSDETLTPSLGQTAPLAEPDEDEGSGVGGTGLTGK